MENKEKNVLGPKKTLVRIIKTLFEFYPVMMPVVLFCIVFNAIISSIPAVFMQNIIAVVENSWQSGDWNSVSGTILRFTGILAALYILSLIASFSYSRMMAVITQGALKKLREKMFNGMQDLPVKYFDTHNHLSLIHIY